MRLGLRPAFPVEATVIDGVVHGKQTGPECGWSTGISVRIYLMAHAPDMPGWFHPEGVDEGDYEAAFMLWPGYWADRQIELIEQARSSK